MKYNILIERIEKYLVYLILTKSFNGIPLFIIEIAENMANDNKFAQFAGIELITTHELENMDKICGFVCVVPCTAPLSIVTDKDKRFYFEFHECS